MRVILLAGAIASVILWHWHPNYFELGRFPSSPCAAFTAWLARKTSPIPDLDLVLPLPPSDTSFDPSVSALWTGVGRDVLAWAGWPSGMAFAKFQPNATLDDALIVQNMQNGAFLLTVPGPTGAAGPCRHGPSEAWVSTDLPISGALETLGAALEAVALRGRRLHAFSVETAALPLCRTGAGACAIWEGSSGRIVLDSDVARRIASSTTLQRVIDRFSVAFAGSIEPNDQPKGVGIGAAAIAAAVGAASTAAISQILVSTGPPLWWCLACPIVLGMLAPFVFNFGLTAVADQMCVSLQLPDDECTDLFWAAFGMAMALSLGSAVPIVFVCRLPDCVKRAVGGGPGWSSLAR